MIAELRIENLGVIAEATVALGPRLVVLTGETGAGKTMVLTALNLLTGGRADAALVRTGASSSAVEGLFVVPASDAAAARALDAGAELDGDELLVLRTMTASSDGTPGRSRAFLGGRAVPQAVLGEVAESLVTVHGQADQLQLRSAARQREVLDRFAGPAHQDLVVDHRRAWTARQDLAADLHDLVTRADERRHEAELLRAGLAEVERVDPQPGEDTELARLVERLSHVEDLRAASSSAHEALSGTDDVGGAQTCVQSALRALEQVAGHDDVLAELARRTAEVGYLLTDVVTELAGYVDGLAADPVALETAQRRRADLATLTRAHGPDVDAVLAWASQAGLRLLDLDSGDEQITTLRDQLAAADARLGDLGSQVTAGRTAAAARLSSSVSEELSGLAMSGARLDVQVRPTDPGPTGADQVEMLFAAHPDLPLLPLAKAASGGELSRVMLALEVSLAASTPDAMAGTFVFDEVDAGVGGRAAVEVGRRLAQLGRTTQVLVVTHLPQVAAFADHHLVVRRSDGVVRSSDVHPVDGDERLAELARMLSGQDSPTARAHAAELLDRCGVGS
ncbi:MAG: DNA repair protein RecN [Micrococcales bacterium]|nr:DNA repair protein RecN [Micrococcales bacterium]MCL2668153.1 DNA repair protein RecN [Micrococcales bacterium]